MSGNWQPGIIAGIFGKNSGESIRIDIAGWVNGSFGLDFRVFWDDAYDEYRKPGWVLTHIESGRVIRAMLGSLADAQDFADRLAEAADWNIADPAGPQHELGKVVRATMDEFAGIEFTTASRLGPVA